MGADLLIYRPAFDRGKNRQRKPKWKDALQAAMEVVPTKDDYHFEEHIDDLKNPSEDQVHALRVYLHGQVKEFKEIWEGNDVPRDVVTCVLGPYELLITGGMSWGDSPGETYQLIDSLVMSGLLDVAGFE